MKKKKKQQAPEKSVCTINCLSLLNSARLTINNDYLNSRVQHTKALKYSWDDKDMYVTTSFFKIKYKSGPHFHQDSPKTDVLTLPFSFYTKAARCPTANERNWLCCIRTKLAINDCCQDHLAQQFRATLWMHLLSELKIINFPNQICNIIKYFQIK